MRLLASSIHGLQTKSLFNLYFQTQQLLTQICRSFEGFCRTLLTKINVRQYSRSFSQNTTVFDRWTVFKVQQVTDGHLRVSQLLKRVLKFPVPPLPVPLISTWIRPQVAGQPQKSQRWCLSHEPSLGRNVWKQTDRVQAISGTPQQLHDGSQQQITGNQERGKMCFKALYFNSTRRFPERLYTKAMESEDLQEFNSNN